MGRRPALYDLDPDTGEATGLVLWFCSDRCRRDFVRGATGAGILRAGWDAEATDEHRCAHCKTRL
jgi:hypothetical protein